MLNKYWRQFKSGTDIRGIATDGVEKEEVNLTDEVIRKISFGFVLWLIKKSDKPYSAIKISIGHDSRVSSERIKKCIIEVLVSLGINCPLAIETSGHAALRENHFLDDGAYLVTKIIIKMENIRNVLKEEKRKIADNTLFKTGNFLIFLNWKISSVS